MLISESYIYAAGGLLLGLLTFLIAIALLPKLLARITPNIDEERELLKGNQAIATYFGLLVASSILGLSVIIAAAILAGFHA